MIRWVEPSGERLRGEGRYGVFAVKKLCDPHLSASEVMHFTKLFYLFFTLLYLGGHQDHTLHIAVSFVVGRSQVQALLAQKTGRLVTCSCVYALYCQ